MHRNFLFVFTLSVLLLFSVNDALRILVVFPMLTKSHSILGQGVVTHLLRAGHEVVHITAFPRSHPEVNLNEIDVFPLSEVFKHQQAEKSKRFKLKNLVEKGNIDDRDLIDVSYDFHKLLLEDSNVVKLLSDPTEKFDAVINEWIFSSVSAGIAPLFQCPLIWMGTTEAHWQVLRIIDTVPNPSYTVDLFSERSPPLDFWQRIEELWTIVKKSFTLNFSILPRDKSLYNEVFPALAAARGFSLPSYEKAVYNGSFMFLNSHPSFGTPFRLPQNAKFIAGYHICGKVKPLPENLQKIMDEAERGVIYFSMGSSIRSSDMTNNMRESLLKMFAKLNQTVIWKFEVNLEKIPPNIHLMKWAPQQSILAHANLKIFIHHGGLLSNIEAIHNAVPIIGIPMLMDGYINMKAIVNKGVGIKVDLKENLADELEEAIQEMLTNTTYKTKAEEVSQTYHNRVVPPGAELVHWVEHVVHTRGAPHLRSPALHVPWYQKMYLDLLATIIAVLFVAKYTVRHVFFSKKSLVQKVNKND